jgi:hypothetical protein
MPDAYAPSLPSRRYRVVAQFRELNSTTKDT